MGPAQGAQSRPVPMPRRNELAMLGPVGFCERRLPRRTSGRDRRSASEEKRRVRPKIPKRTRAAMRPNWLARTAQPPPTVARLATMAKVTAMPARSGRPLLRNGWSERAKTKGRTGRMHGLRMVRMPPAYARKNKSMWLTCSFGSCREPVGQTLKGTVSLRMGSGFGLRGAGWSRSKVYWQLDVRVDPEDCATACGIRRSFAALRMKAFKSLG